jgi:hypothetical protein
MSRNAAKHPLRALRAACALTCCVAALGCGSSLPQRYVIEHDMQGYAFRRYQNSLDVDVPVEANAAQGHSAAYLHRAGKRVDIVTAFITVYERPQALTAEVRQSLTVLPGYKLQTEELCRSCRRSWRKRTQRSTPATWTSTDMRARTQRAAAAQSRSSAKRASPSCLPTCARERRAEAKRPRAPPSPACPVP